MARAASATTARATTAGAAPAGAREAGRAALWRELKPLLKVGKAAAELACLQ